MSSTTQSKTWLETVKTIGKKRAALELWTGVIGNKMIQSHAEEHARNRNAQGRFHRKQIGQEDTNPSDDGMGDQTILGDVTNPTPIVIQGNGSNGGNSLLTLALGAALGGGGIFLGQMLSKPITPTVAPVIEQQPPTANTDTTTTIGLGRIEDYLNQPEVSQ